ncbi:MAG: hypothetical protein HC828_09120 [Blastochloris sp.]|nr:hypothetical protein [Blastochloris sp.]
MTNMKSMKALTATEINAPTAPDPTTITADIPAVKAKPRGQGQTMHAATEAVATTPKEPPADAAPYDAARAGAPDADVEARVEPAVRTDEIRAVVGRIAAAVRATQDKNPADNPSDGDED